MEFKKIALIGAGAVGAYFIYGFDKLDDIDFCIVADGERYHRLKNQGVIINNQTYKPDVKTPEEAEDVDLILVCTKYQGLSEAIDMVKIMVDDHTTVMSLLNGIDSEEIIADAIGESHLLYSVMRISAERRNGKITFNPDITVGVSFGEKDNNNDTDRVKAFASLMEKAGLHYHIHKDILLDQWAKYSMNIIYNLPQAILSVGFGAYFDSEHVAIIRDRLFEEVKTVAQAKGINLVQQQDWRNACKDTARFSTLQDIDAKRHSEIDMLAGVLMKQAKELNIQVPFTEYTYHVIKAIEEKNDGKFDY